MNRYEKYKRDFPDENCYKGSYNWKTVEMTNPKKSYYKNCKVTGVLLDDGNFMVNGVTFMKEEFEIINQDPMNFIQYSKFRIIVKEKNNKTEYYSEWYCDNDTASNQGWNDVHDAQLSVLPTDTCDESLYRIKKFCKCFDLIYKEVTIVYENT